ncbi:hypothetical protein CEXT_232331 [Caerostris extrusa]|uniref:Uncharacterized protein n=1 Tax=Caerostris extrusa TaxID=172846 RepID=A0AAV4PTT6_CAEEX|nr:hypothetical protein CEXT_232331 [Caerostris extrusa]
MQSEKLLCLSSRHSRPVLNIPRRKANPRSTSPPNRKSFCLSFVLWRRRNTEAGLVDELELIEDSFEALFMALSDVCVSSSKGVDKILGGIYFLSLA